MQNGQKERSDEKDTVLRGIYRALCRPAGDGGRLGGDKRDMGGVIFLDLRDREGVLQVVCNMKLLGEGFAPGGDASE